MTYPILTSNLLMMLALIFKFNRLPPQLPILYSRPWGEYQITDWWLIFLIPLIMNGLYFLNIFLYKKYFSNHEFIRTIFQYLNLFLVTAFTIIFLKIIFLVT